ncbi:hypothetical protein [Bacillus sp. Marseille-P3661]|uniref:hypothetical protein n=1 Tax=Bacillus sp. Marseille-P3661 TaxID=1936234 RepID=UPI000C81FC33|nr:hypothetical protein [Bacillus sp. Marseille-P3661]
MDNISDEERNIFEMSIFLPMVLTILNKDLLLIKQGEFKLKKPYIHLIERTITKVHKDLKAVKLKMQKKQMKVFHEDKDNVFSCYLFVYKGYEEKHNYFNPRIKNKVELLLLEYLTHSEVKD